MSIDFIPSPVGASFLTHPRTISDLAEVPPSIDRSPWARLRLQKPSSASLARVTGRTSLRQRKVLRRFAEKEEGPLERFPVSVNRGDSHRAANKILWPSQAEEAGDGVPALDDDGGAILVALGFIGVLFHRNRNVETDQKKPRRERAKSYDMPEPEMDLPE